MLSSREKRTIYENAYIPEHLVEYVTAVSGAEPFLLGDYLFYRSGKHLTVIGYPLIGEFSVAGFEEALDKAANRFKPDSVSIIAQRLPVIEKEAVMRHNSDSYYFRDLKLEKGKKLRSLLRRAARDAVVKRETLGSEHRALVKAFLSNRSLDEASRYIFERIPEYLSGSNSAVLFAARTSEGTLSAFNIFDYGSKNCAFYMFSFFSREHYIPGASDLLFNEAVNLALEEGKGRVNMGLGISPGVARFKKKNTSSSFTARSSSGS
jgi:hypothetical protein